MAEYAKIETHHEHEDIKFSTHDGSLHNLHQVRSILQKWKSK